MARKDFSLFDVIMAIAIRSVSQYCKRQPFVLDLSKLQNATLAGVSGPKENVGLQVHLNCAIRLLDRFIHDKPTVPRS